MGTKKNLIVLSFLLPLFSVAQQPLSFAAIQSAIDTARITLLPEKIYIQFDKGTYVLGDTVWFKAYIFNASYLTPSAQSGMLYIDVAGDDNKVVKQFSLPVITGCTWGNITLAKDFFKEGSYTIRAYTNWMRNFDDSHFFYHQINIAGVNEKSLLVNTLTQQFDVNGKDSVRALLQFKTIDGQPLVNKQLWLTVATGRKALFRSVVNTHADGSSNINFTLTGNPFKVNITAEDKAASQKTTFPLLLTHAANIDLQFMPEGGNFIAGLPAHIGFKAIGEDGRGVDVSGIILNSANVQVATFTSLYKGMGSFDMQPAGDETYTAKITLADGTVKTYPLPVVIKDGFTMQVHNLFDKDSIEVVISATPAFAQQSDNLMLVGQANNFVCFGARVDFKKHGILKQVISKKIFPAGIARFTLLTTAGQPVSERLIFLCTDSIRVNITTAKDAYRPRDSIAVELSVTDADNAAVQSNFSMAVTDDDQVKQEDYAQNITSYILLSSNLKGFIETPGYYFDQHDATTFAALDNLLLTQGWAGYNWQQVFHPTPPVYQPEREFAVKGSVTNIFNKKVPGTRIALISQRPAIIMDTLTDNKGQFVFHNFPAIDTPVFFIEARNRRDKSFNVGITVDEVVPPAFVTPNTPVILPWNVNSGSALLTYSQTKQELDKKLLEGMTLAPVIVTAKKKVNESDNLNGSGNADQVLDEADMFKAGKKTLLQILQEQITGFHQGLFPPISVTHDIEASPDNYLIYDKELVLVIDGVNIENFFLPWDGGSVPEPRTRHLEYVKQYLEYYKAEDIKGIEINYSAKYNSVYNTHGNKIGDAARGVDWAYVEVTTYSKQGPFLKKMPGTYLYRGVPFSWPAKFYRPQYAVKDTSDHSVDLRSTIHWQPNVITNAAGKATVTFYAADKPTTYTVIAEGTDFTGNVAIKTKKIVIEGKK